MTTLYAGAANGWKLRSITMSFKFTLCAAIVVVSAAMSASAFGAPYKCKKASGAVEYSDTPCASGFRWDGQQWVDVDKERRQQFEDDRARKEAQAQQNKDRLAKQEAAAARAQSSATPTPSAQKVAPNASDVAQAESFRDGLPSACSSSHWYPAADGTVNFRIICSGSGKAMDGLVSIKNGEVTRVR